MVTTSVVPSTREHAIGNGTRNETKIVAQGINRGGYVAPLWLSGRRPEHTKRMY